MSTLRWLGFPVRLILAIGFIVFMGIVMSVCLLFWAVISPRTVAAVTEDWGYINSAAWNWAVNP